MTPVEHEALLARILAAAEQASNLAKYGLDRATRIGAETLETGLLAAAEMIEEARRASASRKAVGDDPL